ncbi:hypothetical protein CVT25_005887 [Psilocybe cyanescens]|uniref:Uncharacterized protein n=1 Tax=Psilocybe cyanescens TaxID=93625 RepID=A0A409VM39_PSICY|nr:hypothetical protein CVT25_005887 [Psilocybe cyanescens]
MGVFGYFSYSATERTEIVAEGTFGSTESANKNPITPSQALIVKPETSRQDGSIARPKDTSTFSQADKATAGKSGQADLNEPRIRRFSLLSFVRKEQVQAKPILSAVHEHEKRDRATQAASVRIQHVQLSKDDKRARKSALAVRSLIIGPTTAEPKLTTERAKPQLNKIKSQLMRPKSANKVIAHLRQLPAVHEPSDVTGFGFNPPIHAVCLEHTDLEEHLLHFSKLPSSDRPRGFFTANIEMANVASAPIDALSNMFNDMHVVNLINSPDFGLGQPGDSNGILAGALPTAETVIEGMKQITPQLMALGYATGKAFTPDHSGIYPPRDRMSVLTYWWGLEIVLPPPSLQFLDNAQSISGAVINFLTALSLINNGVREILPFVRYIAQFVDFEFNAIRKQDEGRGVVCAATWIMPAAMVPRPWDFLDPPEQSSKPDSNTTSPAVTTPAQVPLPSTLPGPIYSVLDTVASPLRKSSASKLALAK